MLVLGLDTAGPTLAVGLIRANEVVIDLQVAVPQAHSRQLPALIQTALAHAGITASQIGLVAVSAGPGSYTGLRLGAMAAKVLAWRAAAPVVGVDSLQVLAAPLAAMLLADQVGQVDAIPGATLTGVPGATDLRMAVLLPSRRGRVYGRLYQVGGTGDGCAAVDSPAVDNHLDGRLATNDPSPGIPAPWGDLHEGPAAVVAAALTSAADGAPLLLLGPGGRALADEMLPHLAPGSRWADAAWDLPRGSWVARLGAAAAADLGAAHAVDRDAADAAHVRLADALTFVPTYPGPGVEGPPRVPPQMGGRADGQGAN